MTLSPVFRSESAVRLLAEQGIWQRLAPAIEAQANAVRAIHGDLDAILDAGYRSPDGAVPESGVVDRHMWGNVQIDT